MNKPFAARELLKRRIALGTQLKRIFSEVRYAVGRDPAILLAIENPQVAERGFAEMHRLFEHRVKHRREVTGR